MDITGRIQSESRLLCSTSTDGNIRMDAETLHMTKTLKFVCVNISVSYLYIGLLLINRTTTYIGGFYLYIGLQLIYRRLLPIK